MPRQVNKGPAVVERTEPPRSYVTWPKVTKLVRDRARIHIQSPYEPPGQYMVLYGCWDSAWPQEALLVPFSTQPSTQSTVLFYYLKTRNPTRALFLLMAAEPYRILIHMMVTYRWVHADSNNLKYTCLQGRRLQNDCRGCRLSFELVDPLVLCGHVAGELVLLPPPSSPPSSVFSLDHHW